MDLWSDIGLGRNGGRIWIYLGLFPWIRSSITVATLGGPSQQSLRLWTPLPAPGLPRLLRRLPGGLVGGASGGAGLLGVVPLHGGATDLAGRLHGGQGPSGQDAGGSGVGPPYIT